MKKRIVVLPLVVLAGLAAGAWVERIPLLARYYVSRLARADERARERWVGRVVRLDTAAVPCLLTCLRRDRRPACANAGKALSALAQGWGLDDPRTQGLTARLEEEFAGLGSAGRQAALAVETGLLRAAAARQAVPAGLLLAAAHAVDAAADADDGEVRARAAELVRLLLNWAARPEVLKSCRKLAVALCHDASPANRVAAVGLALRPGLKLLPQILEMLDDPDASVRRAALVAVGPDPNTISTEDLLRWLHDPDVEARGVCEAALRSRGLSRDDIILGRLLTDPDPSARLRIVELLPETELAPGAWLRQLSRDPSPAVRAAAVRAAAEQPLVDLSDRVAQITQNDPDPTVRQIARHYASCQKSRPLEPAGN